METYNTAKIEILFYITQFVTSKRSGGIVMPLIDQNRCFIEIFDQDEVNVGDLIMPRSVTNATKWYLGWVREIDLHPSGYNSRFLLQSIEDGSLCWWSNIGIAMMPRETINSRPEWKWSDKKFDFKKRWFNACYKKRGAYLSLPIQPEFDNEGGVTLGLRKRFNMDENYKPRRHYKDWRKVKVTEMLDFYDENVK